MMTNTKRKMGPTGWVIIALSILYIYMCIEPFMNNREEFIRIMVMVLGGGVGSGFIIMFVLQRYLPMKEEKDSYQEWIEDNTSTPKTKQPKNKKSR